MKPVRCRSVILSLTSSHCSLVLPVMMMKLTLCTGVLYIHNNLGSEIYGIDCATWAHSHSVENRIMTSLFHSMNANQFIAFMDCAFSGCMSDTLPLFIKMRDCSYLQKSENLQIQGSNNYSFHCMFEIDLDFTGSTMFVTDTDVVYFHQTQSKKANHHMYTYSSNHLKVLLSVEVDSFAVEKPLEDGAQGRITRHLTGQHDALSHAGIQAQGWNYDLCGLLGRKTH